MCVSNLPKIATQWNSGATRDSNRGRRVLIPSALTTTPPSHLLYGIIFYFDRLKTPIHIERLKGDSGTRLHGQPE